VEAWSRLEKKRFVEPSGSRNIGEGKKASKKRKRGCSLKLRGKDRKKKEVRGAAPGKRLSKVPRQSREKKVIPEEERS